MSIQFAERTKSMKASALRELAKLTARPEVISFAGGLPDSELFPLEELAEAAQEVLKNHGRQALQYSSTEGYLPLRKHIVDFMHSTLYCSNIMPEDILIVNGSQQGLDFSAKIFVDPGSVVLTESPTYLGAINAFAAYQPLFVEVDSDKDGMIIDELLLKIEQYGDKIRYIYVIPDFQNPSCSTWSLERRQALLKVAKENNLIIVEDNPYGVLSFGEENLPSIYSLDKDEEKNVVFLGTFSKILCPGYRVGWVCTSQNMLSKYIFAKQTADLQTNNASQWEISYYLDKNSIHEHIKRLKALYKHRSEVMVQAMKTYFPSQVEFVVPQGGFFTWLTFPTNIDTRELAIKCLERNVAYVPGGAFFPNGGKENHARLCYSYMPDEKIEEGIKILGECLSM